MAYHVGMALSVIGLLMFFSAIFSFLIHFGDFDDFVGRTRSIGTRAFGGVVLVMVGGVARRVGVQGPFGMGMLLDPERAEQDLEPWARLSGRLNDAAFSEMATIRETIAEAVSGRHGPEGTDPAPEIRIRCQTCQALNDEQARFCDQCGVNL